LGCASENLHLARSQEEPCAVYVCVRKMGVAGCHECAELECLVGDVDAMRCPLRERFGDPGAGERFQQLLPLVKGTATVGREGAEIPQRKAERLRSYLRVLEDYAQQQVSTISSHQLASAAGVRSSLVRRDLSSIGNYGTPGRGYAVDGLGLAIRRSLRLERHWPTVWLGNAALADADTTRRALADVNCELVGVFDNDGAGTPIAGLEVQELAQASEEIGRKHARVAVLASEDVVRQEVVQELAAAGIAAVLNLTPVRLREPVGVAVEDADLGSQLFRLLSRVQSEAGKADAGQDRTGDE
jgi:redox-sensing transcriptional repressor